MSSTYNDNLSALSEFGQNEEAVGMDWWENSNTANEVGTEEVNYV